MAGKVVLASRVKNSSSKDNLAMMRSPVDWVSGGAPDF
mgnify:FL=1